MHPPHSRRPALRDSQHPDGAVKSYAEQAWMRQKVRRKLLASAASDVKNTEWPTRVREDVFREVRVGRVIPPRLIVDVGNGVVVDAGHSTANATIRRVLTRQTTPAILVRQLAASDSISDLTDLLHCAYKPLLDMGFRYWATRQTEEDTRRRIASGKCLVAELKGKVVGTLCYYRHVPWDASPWMKRSEVAAVGQFGVEPELQRQGIGTALMRHAERIALSEGAAEVALSTADAAEHLISYYTNRGIASSSTATTRCTRGIEA
jgi:GNAT superfamily N-acetyltransferase